MRSRRVAWISFFSISYIGRNSCPSKHDLGFRTTIQMTYASLYNQAAIEMARNYHLTYGDEIGLTFVGLNCKEFRERFQNKELAIWLFSTEDKRAIVDTMFERFFAVFGFYPASTGAIPRYVTLRPKREMLCCLSTGKKVPNNQTLTFFGSERTQTHNEERFCRCIRVPIPLRSGLPEVQPGVYGVYRQDVHPNLKDGAPVSLTGSDPKGATESPKTTRTNPSFLVLSYQY